MIAAAIVVRVVVVVAVVYAARMHPVCTYVRMYAGVCTFIQSRVLEASLTATLAISMPGKAFFVTIWAMLLIRACVRWWRGRVGGRMGGYVGVRGYDRGGVARAGCRRGEVDRAVIVKRSVS